MKKKILGWTQISVLIKELQTQISKDDIIFGIPKGGMIVSNFLKGHKTMYPQTATVFVDDIEDSGETKKKWTKEYPNAKWLPLIVRKHFKDAGYVVFPWEDEKDDKEHIITKLLEAIGEDPKREGLTDTPKRVMTAYDELLTPQEFDFTTFSSKKYDQMITMKGISYYTFCEHHMLPFFGKVSIGYIPNKKIVGLSKLPRAVEYFSRRLNTQEYLTQNIANFLNDNLKPQGVGVEATGRHLCMEMRGIKTKGETKTCCLKGNFFDDSMVRDEFFKKIQ